MYSKLSVYVLFYRYVFENTTLKKNPKKTEEKSVDKQKMTETKAILKCIGFITVPILILVIAMMASSFHVVEEGHVGIYFKQGALMVKLMFSQNIKRNLGACQEIIRIHTA